MKLIEWCCSYFFLMKPNIKYDENEIYDEEINQFVTQFNNDAMNIQVDEEYMNEFEEIVEIEQDSVNNWNFWFKI